MHFEILVEDISGKAALDILVPKIIGDSHTFKVISYKGIGHIPKNLKPNSAKTDTLLNNLPKLINGYARSWNNYPAALFFVCDLDDKCLKEFKKSLNDVLLQCQNKPQIVRFCIAIEEGEAWFLGDINAIKQAYPAAKEELIQAYKNDSICGTWELLADVLYNGGSKVLRKKPFQVIGEEKFKWAKNISPYMDVNNNHSPSFNYFKNRLIQLI